MNDYQPNQTYQPPIHQSSAACWLRCQRCFLFRYRWGLVPKQPPVARAAGRGRLTHRLLELGPSRMAEFQADIQQQIHQLEQRIEQEGDPLGLLETAIRQLTQDSAMACSVCSVFWETFPAFNPDNDSSPLRSIVREQSISAVISPDSFPPPASQAMPAIAIAGRLDQICQSADSGNIWLMDYKTTSQDPQTILTGYQFSLQCRIYRLLADAYCQREELPSPKGFILNIIRMPTIVMCSKDKSFNDYLNRCIQWYKEKGLEACAAYQIQYSEPIMPFELLSVLYRIHRSMEQPPVADYYPRDLTTSYCSNYRSTCVYYPLCSSDPAAWPALIEQSFVQKPPYSDTDQETVDDVPF